MLRAYWKVRRPATHGALVAMWHEGEILIVKNSYRRQYTLPGGYVRPSESAQQAAARELQEEVNLRVPPDSLDLVYSDSKPFENRRDRVSIVELEVEEAPDFQVDNRELVWAGFKSPRAVLDLNIVPHLREYLESRES